VRSQHQTTETELAELNKELEEARKESKALEQKRNFKIKAGARIEVEKRNLRGLLAEADTNGEKEILKRRVREAVLGMSKAVVALQEGIKEVDQGQRAMEMTRLASFPMEDLVEQQRAELEAASETLSELRVKVRDAGRELEESKRLLGSALREARAATGGAGSEPPIDVANRWREENLPGQKEAVEVMLAELEMEAEALDTVDPGIVAEYREAQEIVREVERDILRREQQKREEEALIDEVKAAWLAGLEELIERISTKFSAHFASMGFAGQVLLHRGKFENDFDNYGVDIMVKYRDREPLQKLTAHHQSGGERSVATALYMLALQELTTVPFRCVDEINQGMDAANEKRVFELLVRTSCQENSAQYFLLTPKLLPGLDYSPRMNVLIVNNGTGMCHHSQWKMEEFRERAQA